MVDSGCLATKAIDDKGIGAKTADLAIKYFKGTNVEDIPSIVVPYDNITVNTDDAKVIGVDIDSIDFGSDSIIKVTDSTN
jgi:putative ABC transport system substrate-binding protein